MRACRTGRSVGVWVEMTAAGPSNDVSRTSDIRQEALRLLLQTAQLEADPSARGFEERVARQLSVSPERVTDEYVRQLEAGLALLRQPSGSTGRT